MAMAALTAPQATTQMMQHLIPVAPVVPTRVTVPALSSLLRAPWLRPRMLQSPSTTTTTEPLLATRTTMRRKAHTVLTMMTQRC